MTRGFEIVTVVIVVFFAVGIAVGILLVIAFPLIKSLFGSPFRRLREDRGRIESGDWQEPSGLREDEKPTWWQDS